MRSTLGIHVHPALEIKEGAEGERGLFMTGEVPPDTVLIRVPLDSMLTVDVPALASLRVAFPALREDDLLAIALLYERFGRPATQPSKWQAHLALLPDNVPNALNLSTSARARLEGSSLHALVYRQQKQVVDDFAEVNALGLTVGAERTPLAACPWWTLETYRWALTQLHSRFVSITTRDGLSRKCMVPYLDLLNHSLESPPALVHGFVPAPASAQEGEGSLVVTASRRLRAGEEACLSYGPHGTLKLVQLYGFALKDNPHDALELWSVMAPTAPHYAAKAQALAALDLHPPFLLRLQAPVVSPQLLAAIRIQRAQGSEELARLHQALAGPLSEENERVTLATLQEALIAMREALPMTPGKEGGRDEAAKDMEMRLVYMYLQSERQVLTRGLEALEALAKDLDEK